MGMTDAQFNKHLADTLLILKKAKEEIQKNGNYDLLDEYIENLKSQITKP